MDDAATLRRKAAQCSKNAASATTASEAMKLNELREQLDLWADDMEREEEAEEAQAKKHQESQRFGAGH